MINNKVIENELKETEKQIEDLLLRIKELRKEVYDMLPPEIKKVVHERVVLDRNKIKTYYIDLNDYLNIQAGRTLKVKNYVRYNNRLGKYSFLLKNEIILTNHTVKKEVILTYIPSENEVIIVER